MAKAESITLDEARELVGDAALWPRMREFLWDFAPQVHESWLGGLVVGRLGGEESAQSQDNAAAQLSNYLNDSSPRVKAYILSSLGVEPFFHDFPKEDWSRLALLDGATLLEIAKWLGALACADELRRVTDGATVRGLKSALRGIYPEVFGFTAYFVKDVKELGGLVVGWLGGEGADMKLDADFVVGVGYSLLHAAVAHLPDPLRQRLRLKLPKNITTKLPNHEATKLPNLQLLLKLRFPEAYSLCCS
jgi:hypothetical protein